MTEVCSIRRNWGRYPVHGVSSFSDEYMILSVQFGHGQFLHPNGVSRSLDLRVSSGEKTDNFGLLVMTSRILYVGISKITLVWLA